MAEQPDFSDGDLVLIDGVWADLRAGRPLRESFDPGEPRDRAGKWTDGGGGAAAARAAPTPKPAGKARPLTAGKSGGRLAAVRDVARRRMVIAALRSEAELAGAIGGRQLPDSEPADVVYLLDARGEPVTDPEALKKSLAQREDAVRRLRRLPSDDPARAPLEELLAAPLHFFEVKTLLTQSGAGAVHMGPEAVARKLRWEKRYGGAFHTVALDKRRGKKHSGHTLYYKTGVGSAKLAGMAKHADFSELLAAAAG